jgi:hypothetical protein
LSPVDRVLADIKKDLFSNFTQKWSQHTHPNDSTCNSAIVIDGLWKCHRAKCAYDNKFVKTTEFGDIQTGCVQSPEYKSYYCSAHKGYELSILVRDKVFKVKPQNIKVFGSSNYFFLNIYCNLY